MSETNPGGSASELRLKIDKLLTIKDAAFVLTRDLGRQFTENKVRAYADRGKLPFFKDEASGKRVIFESELFAFYRRQQNHAVREINAKLDAAAGK